MRRCKVCGKLKPHREFYPFRKRQNGQRQTYCRTCSNRRQHALIENSKLWIREYARQWRSANRGVVGAAKAFLDDVPAGLTTYYRLRHFAIMRYGGYRCACCGTGEPQFLTIDHVNNNGAQHRRALGGSWKFYRWLHDAGYPRGFQVLCSNCNHGRHRNGGICPHQDKRVSATTLRRQPV